jgi:hypothetical protein
MEFITFKNHPVKLECNLIFNAYRDLTKLNTLPEIEKKDSKSIHQANFLDTEWKFLPLYFQQQQQQQKQQQQNQRHLTLVDKKCDDRIQMEISGLLRELKICYDSIFNFEPFTLLYKNSNESFFKKIDLCKLELFKIEDSFFQYRLKVSTQDKTDVFYQFITFDMGFEISNDNVLSWRGMDYNTLYVKCYKLELMMPNSVDEIMQAVEENKNMYYSITDPKDSPDEIIFKKFCNKYIFEKNEPHLCQVIVYKNGEKVKLICYPLTGVGEETHVFITPNTQLVYVGDFNNIGIRIGTVNNLDTLVLEFENIEIKDELNKLIEILKLEMYKL